MDMAAKVTRFRRAGLERSCAKRDWVRIGTSRPGFERLEACFGGHAFEAHRHDTYAIGITLAGVQAFGYRGSEAHSLAGEAFVLHPDELHDGHAGTAGGFRYRILYVEPRLIHAALGGGGASLPFLRGAVTGDARLQAAIVAALADPDLAIDDLRLDQNLVELAQAMAALDPSTAAAAAETPNRRAVDLARDYLDAHLLESVPSSALERLTGLSRFALTRHFRRRLGTSPHRYVVMRRLERARRLIQSGTPLAGAAADCGFADQSHLSRHFKQAYGVPPGRWSGMLV
jgi:AraC-like DNA-binding protein